MASSTTGEGEAYRSLPMAGALTVNNAEACQGACLAGLGIIQAPAVGVAWQLELVEILQQYRGEPMPVSLLFANRRNLPRRVQAFMSWMADTLAPQPDPVG